MPAAIWTYKEKFLKFSSGLITYNQRSSAVTSETADLAVVPTLTGTLFILWNANIVCGKSLSTTDFTQSITIFFTKKTSICDFAWQSELFGLNFTWQKLWQQKNLWYGSLRHCLTCAVAKLSFQNFVTITLGSRRKKLSKNRHGHCFVWPEPPGLLAHATCQKLTQMLSLTLVSLAYLTFHNQHTWQTCANITTGHMLWQFISIFYICKKIYLLHTSLARFLAYANVFVQKS